MVSVFGACQKKEYPTFNYTNTTVSTSQKQVSTPAEVVAADVETPAISTPQVLSASADEEVVVMTEEEVALSVIPSEAITPNAAPGVAKTTAAKPAKLTWTQKIAAKKIQKQIKKASSPETAKAAKAENTIALLSLVFGGAGLLLLLLGSGLGILLGIAGLVLGIVGLGRIKKGQAPDSTKTMSLLGVIFGGLVTLLGLIVVAAVASYGGFY
ncbi:hypothetical protein GCM10007390_44520 [Persicitalea jodogahamensis]|uniref:DUF4190 domain-containing protein n=2 Tax=Persicitalea jodogahamensis TaxID=402147 RepID=A0A8J3DB17_9BACT|nr:hypothetical protein GCM10007390_44520 [Persicitalea jodogahamensis]